MLSMKTLGVAVVAAGSALLLWSGTAAAQTLQLDGATAPTAVRLAVETIETGADKQTKEGAKILGYDVVLSETSTSLQVTAKSAIPAGYFVRVALDGAVFRGTLVTISGYTPVSGGPLHSHVVYRADNGIPFNGGTQSQFTIEITDKIAVSTATAGSVTATIRAYSEQFNAIEDVAPLSTRFFGGSAVIISKVSGVSASVSAGRTATADAATAFRWFVDRDGENTSQAVLGNFRVEILDGVIDADDGTDAEAEEIVPNGTPSAPGGVHLVVEGELGIGAFNLERVGNADVDLGDPSNGTGRCLNANDGSADDPLTGNVSGTKAMPDKSTPLPTIAEGTGGVGAINPTDGSTYELCVNVDTMGPMSNAAALPATEFNGTIIHPGTKRTLASGVVGRIDRNGASVEIAFLSEAPRYNQRLIIVNHHPTRDLTITDADFHNDKDREATLLSSGDDLVIGANSRREYLVADMLEITPGERTSGTLFFDAAASTVSVATILVNKDDSGSTDTVMWPVK